MFTAVTKASAVATIGLPSSKRVCSVWVFTLMHDVFTAVATIALPGSKGVCGVWVFTRVCLQQLLQLRYPILTAMWCLGVYLVVFTAVATITLPSSKGVCGVWVFTLMHDVFTAVATIALPSSNGYVVFGCLPGCVYSSCYNCATQF